MPDAATLLHAALPALGAMAALALLTWLVACARRNVAIVDRVWPWFFIVGALAAGHALPATGPRTWPVSLLLGVWGLRLSAHITWRGWGHAEDRRYQAIRARNQPHFAWKSLYLVFGLQALLAWVAAAPLLGALASARPLGPLDVAGLALCAFGIAYEALADAQLARFTADPSNRGRVMDLGLWRWSRHPNYFGEACTWWGFWLVALSAGAGWSVVSPLVLTTLLLKVSGVSLLEQDIVERRPGYRDYVRRTNAFVPGPRRKSP